MSNWNASLSDFLFRNEAETFKIRRRFGWCEHNVLLIRQTLTYLSTNAHAALLMNIFKLPFNVQLPWMTLQSLWKTMTQDYSIGRSCGEIYRSPLYLEDVTRRSGNYIYGIWTLISWALGKEIEHRWDNDMAITKIELLIDVWIICSSKEYTDLQLQSATDVK